MLEFEPLTIYLDSNVLFSATYLPTSPFVQFWAMTMVTPATSSYSLNEVQRHIKRAGQQAKFNDLVSRTKLVKDAADAWIPAQVTLAKKDRPILAAAIAARVDYLLTGDLQHFGHLYGKSVDGVEIVRPGEFLEAHRERLKP